MRMNARQLFHLHWDPAAKTRNSARSLKQKTYGLPCGGGLYVSVRISIILKMKLTGSCNCCSRSEDRMRYIDEKSNGCLLLLPVAGLMFSMGCAAEPMQATVPARHQAINAERCYRAIQPVQVGSSTSEALNQGHCHRLLAVYSVATGTEAQILPPEQVNFLCFSASAINSKSGDPGRSSVK